MKDYTSKLTENDQKYYAELKKDFPKFYTNAILTAEAIAINHNLPLKISADIERNCVLLALDICRYWRQNA
jgi:hypothetical protein